MISIQTRTPVKYLNAAGTTKTDRKAARQDKRKKRVDTLRNIWQVGKDTGLLAGAEQLAMGMNKGDSGSGAGAPPVDYGTPPAPPKSGWKELATWKKAAIITGAVALVGGISYVIWKKSQAK